MGKLILLIQFYDHRDTEALGLENLAAIFIFYYRLMLKAPRVEIKLSAALCKMMCTAVLGDGLWSVL